MHSFPERGRSAVFSQIASLRDEAAERFLAFLDSEPELGEAEDFAAIIAAAIDMHGIPVDAMAQHFGVSRSTIGRWRAGANAPQPFARRLVTDWIREQLRTRLI
jgi:hypothetical protein